MTGLLLLVFMATLGLWIAAAVRGPGGESRQDRARQGHLLAGAVGAGTALVLFALLQVAAREGMPYSATPWHALLCAVLGLGLWAGLAGYLQGREWLLPGASGNSVGSPTRERGEWPNRGTNPARPCVGLPE
jgi:hypothetical protein